MVDETALASIRQTLETVQAQIGRALRVLEPERSLRWRCRTCGALKHFTRPMPAEVAPPCPKCHGMDFERL